MEPTPPTRAPARGITRRELEAVIRRAAELYAADADADERISEEELLRIASELGLPTRHVRQALLELPGAPSRPSLLDRFYGPATVTGARAVPGDADTLFRRLEDYLTTKEYLHPLRWERRRAWYAPADDPISKIARAVSRPGGRYHLARARRATLAVEPLERGTAHVRLDLDLSDRRKGSVAAGTTAGGLIGALAGAGLALAAAPAAAELAGPVAGAAAGLFAFGGTLTTSLTAALAMARTRFRGRLAAARLELDGLLDRLERGQPLDPPPAPWRRRLGARLTGPLPGSR